MPATLCHICKGEEGAKTEHSDILEKLLPGDYNHLVCSFESSGDTHFRAALKLKLTTEEEVQKWLKDFQASSGVTWRKSKTYPPDAARFNKYRVDLRCQHKVYGNPIKRTKNTSCPSTMYLVLKKQAVSQEKKSRLGDEHIKDGYFFYVNVTHQHNHEVSSAEALRYRPVSDATIEKLNALFRDGHSPSSALDIVKRDLQKEAGENYLRVVADRFVCPDLQTCYRLYYKLFKKEYGVSKAEEITVDLATRLCEYNQGQGDDCAIMAKTEDNQLVIAVCTPVMKKIHAEIRQGGDMVFIDSFGFNYVRQKHRVFLLLTHSSSGGLPLGALITTSDSQATLKSGFRLLKSIFPANSFYGRQDRGPQVIVTGDCPALVESLQAVYPDASLLLCVLNLLQAMWRWLWTTSNGVALQDRAHLLTEFESLVWADSPLCLDARYKAFREDRKALKYPKFVRHLAKVYGRRGEWAICLHLDLLTRGHSTDNIIKSALRIAKEKVLHHLKVYNLTQLVDFVTTKMEVYYIRRLTDLADNRVTSYSPLIPNSHVHHSQNVDCDKIVQEDEANYIVPSFTSAGQQFHHVNMAVGCCSCPVGISGGFCKHQSAVLSKFDCHESLPQPSSPELCDAIATIKEGTTEDKMDYQMLYLAPEETDSNAAGEELEAELMRVFECLKKKLRDDPSFQKPIASFVSSFGKLSTDTVLISALSAFGKHQIGAQPTSLARRKVAIGGEKALKTRRPAKSSTRDHQSNKKARKRSAPDSLSECVEQNA